MSKLRVYEYAKKQGMNSKEILEILRRLDVPIRNHMSVMEGDSIEKVEKYMERLKSGATKDVKATPKAQKEAPTPTPTQSRAPQQGVARQNAPTQSRAPQQGVARQNAPSQSRAPQQGATKQNAPTPSRAPQQSRAPKQNSAPRKNQSSFQDTPQKEKMPRPMKTNEDNNQSKSKVEARPQFQDKDKRKGQSQQGPQNQGQPKQGRPQQGRPQQGRPQQGRPQQGRPQQGRPQQGRPQQGRPQQGQSGQRRGRGSGKRGRSNQQERTEPVTKISQKVVEHITITGSLSVAELAHKMHKEPSEIIKKLMLLGTMATINQELEAELVHVIAGEYGMTVEEKIPVDETIFEQIDDTDEPEKLKERGPVVTVMGHVDHGKTTLLDAIRQTNVTASEAGGITQHIGAYQVDYNKKKITFLDTPGHEAFTTMRARGAKVTDVAIIVVAADDGVMPQTREAISHAQAAHVPIIVAVNKMDKPDVNPDKVKQELMEMKLVPEEWGGDTIFVPVSALNKEGMDDLMEMVMLVSEVEELRANPDKLARGTVIDAELDKGKGPIATILIQSGTLKIGDPIVVGTTYGRVRAMMNDQGRRIKTATPSTPVAILGLHDVPHAGDQFKVFDDEKKARIIGESRASKLKESEQKSVGKISLDELFEQIQQGEVKELNIIIKADVHGSADAMKSSLEKIEVEDIKVKIIHTGVGAINESDVTLAAASNAIIIGFNVRPQPQAKQVADREKVDIRLHRVIYNVTEEIESAMKGLLDPEFEEKVIGTAEVRQIFKVSKVGTIAGSYVKEGFVTRDSSVRLIRDGVVVHEGKLDVLRRFKDDVKEVQTGYECGITLENFNDIKEGDLIESYIMQEIPRV